MDEYLDLATESARRAFDACRASTDQPIVGYAICSDDTAVTFSPVAASAAAADAFSHGAKEDFLFVPENWDIYSEPEHVQEVASLIYARYEADEDYENNPDWHEQHRQRVFELMTAALERLNDEGYFGQGADRDAVVVLPWVVDSEVPRTHGATWSKRTNPAAVHKSFQQWLAETNYWGPVVKRPKKKKKKSTKKY